MREYPHDGEASFVHADAFHQRVAGGAAALVRQLSQLDDRHADDAVLAGEAVVLYGDVQLVGLWAVFVTENAGRNDTGGVRKVVLKSRDEFTKSKITSV